MDRPLIVFLHAHPDDESILAGAVTAKASALGFETAVLYGTRGDAGETSADLGDETLGDRRVAEARGACAALGVDRVEFLGWDDSGMAGTETTEQPNAFCNASLDAIADAVEALIDRRPLAIFGYDRNGTYGHPDHLKVHQAAYAVAERVDAPWTIDVTYNREYLASLPDHPYGEVGEDFAESEEHLTHYVDGLQWFDKKMEALMHHASQTPDDWEDTEPDVAEFRRQFGAEWFKATAMAEDADLGPLGELLKPKSSWSGEPG